MTKHKHKNLRVFCLCGQKMKVTPPVYGRPAKCPACHQKWFVPTREEISRDVSVLYLKEHPELLRKSGELVRQGPAEEKSGDKGEAQPGADVNAVDRVELSAPGMPEGAPDVDSRDFDDVEGYEGRFLDSRYPTQTLQSPNPRAAEAEPVVLRHKQRVPLDVFESLKVLWEYRMDLKQRQETCSSEAERATLEAYERSIARVHNTLDDNLKRACDVTTEHLATIENKLTRLKIDFRVGDVQLEQFLSQTDDLRIQREMLQRYAYNLAAWRQADSSTLAGATAVTPLESFDEEAFSTTLPQPDTHLAERPVYLVYAGELSEALQMRAAVERRRAEWRHLEGDQNFPEAMVNEGIEETEAVLERIKARIVFYHQRLERLLMDCNSDIEALQLYRKEFADRVAQNKGEENLKRGPIREVQREENDLIRVKSILQKAISANSPNEIPPATNTLMQRLGHKKSVHLFAPDSVVFLLAAVCVLAGLFLHLTRFSTGDEWLIGVSAAVAAGLAVVAIGTNTKARVAAIIPLALLQVILLLSYLYAHDIPGGQALDWSQTVLLGMWAVFLVSGTALTVTGTAMSVNHSARGDRPYSGIWLWLSFFVIVATGLVFFTAPMYRDSGWEMGQHSVPDTPVQPAPPVSVNAVPPFAEAEGALEESTADPVQQAGVDEADGSEIPIVAEEGESVDRLAEAGVEGATPGAAVEEGARENAVEMILNGVIHGEGADPRFRATLYFPDGRIETRALHLGDTIVGEWVAAEYNIGTQKLTITNEKQMLILQAGTRVLFGQGAAYTDDEVG